MVPPAEAEADDRTGRRFRVARAADSAAVRAITEAAYAAYVPLLGRQPVPVTEEYGPRIAAEQVHLLEVDGEAVGLLVLERHPNHAMLFSIAVRPDRHGAGHGRALLRRAERIARGWGVGELRLYTNALMRRNLAIYREAGFREAGRRPHPSLPGNTLVDMVRPIGRPAGNGRISAGR